jgi:pimeloyl-ACP methyl ester carboxylesterase
MRCQLIGSAPALRPFEQLAFDSLPETPSRPHAFSRMQTRELELDSSCFGRHRVHVRELGSGPPLLLIHGLMTTSYSWRYVAEPLSQRFRVITPDLVGCGRSDKPDRSYAPAALASWIGELMRALGIRGCTVIGNSLGGYLCIQLALRDPDAIGRLVDIHSPGVPELRLWALHAALALPGARALIAALARRDPERWAHRNVHYFDERLKSREEAREYGAPLAGTDGARAFVRYLAETIAPRPMGALLGALERRKSDGQPFPVPLLLIYARRDPMVSPRVGVRLAELIPSAELVWLEDSSHFAQVDSPEELLELALPFLLSA